MHTTARKDITQSETYQKVESMARLIHRPGSGAIADASEIEASPDGKTAVFSGALWDKLEGGPKTRICLADLVSGDIRVMTSGPNVDRSPKWSPDGTRLAYLSDRAQAGDFQLYFLNPASNEIKAAPQAAPRVGGWVEYFSWSPNGRHILLGVAGHGADISGGQGAVSSKRSDDGSGSWMPDVDTGTEDYRWRSAWLFDVQTGKVRKLDTPGINIWEAVWCGPDRIAAVTSPSPGEEMWYSATLNLIDIVSGQSQLLYKPTTQLGWPSASPSGDRLAVVEACCSDRWVVAGDLLVLNTDKPGEPTRTASV